MIMLTMTVYPVGDADTCLLDLANGEKILIDYADYHDPDQADEKRIDLADALRQDLRQANRDNYDVVAFTHLDDDHIHGASTFFEFLHAQKYQGEGRIKIKTLWVPAAAITETKKDLCAEARVVQAEARHRLLQGTGIRVFSRPDSLKAWLEGNGRSLDERKHLITDAGELVPDVTTSTHGVEFFVHSPFAEHCDGDVVQRNDGALVLQATFADAGRQTRIILGADVPCDVLGDIVRVSRYYGNDDRLLWDVFKLPHHCSYTSLGPDQGAEETVPIPNVAWLYEKQGQARGILVSSSRPIPSDDKDKQPPHRQAAAYYRKQATRLGGEFLVTMSHPTEGAPRPIVIAIDHLGATTKKPGLSGAAFVPSVRAPRAG